MGLIPGSDTCDRQCFRQELHWWHCSEKCVGLVCPPPQLPYQIQLKKLIPNILQYSVKERISDISDQKLNLRCYQMKNRAKLLLSLFQC